MYKEIMDILRCPLCGSVLMLTEQINQLEEIVEGELICKNTHKWFIREGVIDFNSKEQEFVNNWTETDGEKSFEEVDKYLEENSPKNVREMRNKIVQNMVNYINADKPKYILDIATGRGDIITRLAKKINYTPHIICTDLSYKVLKDDRIKINRINSLSKVSYIACDATMLPLQDNSIDIAVSFVGIQNMVDIADKGIKEVCRVINNEGKLLNTFVVIEKESQGYKALEKFSKDNNIESMTEYFILDGIKEAHSDNGFKRIIPIQIDQGIGEKNELDLLPYQGEWFAMYMFQCEK